MISEPVVKDLEGARKTHTFGIIALETRQGVILAGAFVAHMVVCYYLAALLGLNTATAFVAFLWLEPLAAVFAFVTVDGKHLDDWLHTKLLSVTRPDVLIHAQPDPDNPTRSLRNSVQRALPAEKFWWEMLACKDGTHLVAFEVEPVALSLVGETERQRVYHAAIDLYNRIDFEVVEFIRSKEGSTARYTRRLRRTVSESIRPEEKKLGSYAERHLSYLEDTVPRYNIFERRGYLILPYNPSRDGKTRGQAGSLWGELKKLFGLGARPSKRDAKRRQEEAEAAYPVLSGRAAILHEGYVRMGCRIRALTDLELAAFLKEQTSEWDPDLVEGSEINLYNPVTLEHAGYEMLPEEERSRMARAADEVREEAPIAFAAGELSVAEKIAPDTVRIFPDYLRVEGRYHATIYVKEWADEVYFGMLEPLTHIEGRVKLVKFIRPQPKNKALKLLRARLAALGAAARTADNGDLSSSQQRELAYFTIEAATSELTADRQRYLELSCLIHVEADTEEGLAGMVNQVTSTLAQYRTEAKLCREEAWEGFLSCLPLGREHLKQRYTRKGMLSRPLACLFSFGTQQIDHQHGVFVGIDLTSSSPITLDNRELMNPHSLTIGQSGGGKTFVVKCLSTRQRMQARRVVIIDPQANSQYARVARQIGGEFALIAPGSPHKINPFDLHEDYLNIDLLDDATQDAGGEDAEESFRRARLGALDGKVQELTRTVSLMLSSDSRTDEGLSGAEAGYVERAVYEAYARKGILRDPDTHHHEPPIFPDFFSILKEYAEENRDVAAPLHEKLYSWHSGALSTLFDSQTNLDLSNKYLVFQISKVKDRQKGPVYHSILEFLSGILSNRDEVAECYMDEFASMLKDEMTAEFAETMFRSARGRNCGMHAISQQPLEFFASRHGQAIWELAATHMIFRHQYRKSAEATASYYDFSEEETQGLLNLQPGEGYLVVGQTRVPLQVKASAEEEELFNTQPRGAEEQRISYAAATPGGGARGGTALAAPPAGPPAGTGDPEGSTSTSRPPARKDGAWRPYARTRGDAPALDGTRLGTGGPTEASGDEEPPPLELSWGEGPTPVYAFVGEGASIAAAKVARLFAEAGRERGAYVLAVDAGQGGADLFERLAREEVVPPDLYLKNGEADTELLGLHIAPTAPPAGNPALMAVAPPEDADKPAHALIEAAKEIFDVCVVACPLSGSYASGWLLEADTVVGCSSEEGAGDALRVARAAEDLRGKNGTLLCTAAPPERARKEARLHESGMEGRRLYALGGAGEAAERDSRALAGALARAGTGTGEDGGR